MVLIFNTIISNNNILYNHIQYKNNKTIKSVTKNFIVLFL